MKLRELFEARQRSVGIIFGRFNPPHKGHRAAWEMASENDAWFVGTNQSTQGPKDPLPYDVKIEAMEAIYPEIRGHIMPEQSWLTMASAVYKKYGNVVLNLYTDEEWVSKAINQYNGVEGPHGLYNFKVINTQPTPRLSSATALRAAVQAGDREAFSDAAGVDADTPVAGKPFFDLVAEYLMPYQNAPKKVAKKKKEPESAENSVNEFAPLGSGNNMPPRGPKNKGREPWDNGDSGNDPYSRPEPEYYSRSIDFFGKFEADHFDDEEFDKKTGVFKGYWDDEEGRVQIAYFKFDDPKQAAKDFDESPGMGWYYEPQNEDLNEFTRSDDDNDDGEEDDAMEAKFTVFSKGKPQTGTVRIFPGTTTDVEYHLNGKVYIKSDMQNVDDYDDFIENAAGYIQEIIQLKGDGHHFVDSDDNLKDSLAELSSELLGRYKKAASADASQADKEGDYARANKRFSGIIKATKKQFANDEKKHKSANEEAAGVGIITKQNTTVDVNKGTPRKNLKAFRLI